MKRIFFAMAGVTTVTALLAASSVAFGAEGSGTATDAANQTAACDVAASPSGVTGTNTGSRGTTTSGSTGTSTSALSASDSSAGTTSTPSTTNCTENCPPDLGSAVTALLSPDPVSNVSTAGNPVCDPSLDAFCISTSDPNEGTGNPLTPVTKLLPSQGIIAIGTADAGDAASANSAGLPAIPFYIFYDGYPTTISPLGGYLGLNGNDFGYALLGLVASTDPNDNFNRLGGNVPLIGNILVSLQNMAENMDAFGDPDAFGQLLPGLNSQGTGASPICDPNDLLCISTHDADAGTGNPLAPITRILPSQGILALGPYNPDTGETLVFTPAGIDLNLLYLFFDGEPTNIDPLGGYVGLAGGDFDVALLGLVASLKNTDNFNRLGGNLPIIGYLNTPLTQLSPVLIRIANP